MCVIAWAWRVHPRWPLVVLANRDERHARASAPLDWWEDAPAVLAGRDLEAGGTWLGVSRTGRFAAVTNRGGASPPDAPSRGDLTGAFLAGRAGAAETAAIVAAAARRYAGFNLLVGDADGLYFVSNREPDQTIEPGIGGMANGSLDEAVNKVERLKQTLSRWCEAGDDPEPEAWFALLADASNDGDPRDAIFVRGTDYGTRSSSIVAFGANGAVLFIERVFDSQGVARGMRRFDFARETA